MHSRNKVVPLHFTPSISLTGSETGAVMGRSCCLGQASIEFAHQLLPQHYFSSFLRTALLIIIILFPILVLYYCARDRQSPPLGAGKMANPLPDDYDSSDEELLPQAPNPYTSIGEESIAKLIERSSELRVMSKKNYKQSVSHNPQDHPSQLLSSLVRFY
jgi:hypothetical protein